MIKSLSIAGVLLILFTSCAANNWDDSIITNNSDYQVKFKFNHTKEYQLEIGERVEFKTEAYQRIQDYSPDKRVVFSYNATNTGYTGEFNTRQSWTVKVNNITGEKASLSADDWMDEMKDILPGKDDDENHTGKIYTKTPSFTVKTESGFPAFAEYSKSDDTEEETETDDDTDAENTDVIFYVTIRF